MICSPCKEQKHDECEDPNKNSKDPNAPKTCPCQHRNCVMLESGFLATVKNGHAVTLQRGQLN